MASYGRKLWYMVQNGLQQLFFIQKKHFGLLEENFEAFEILTLRNFCKKNCGKRAKIGKIINFEFWINRQIWPILMICELHKVSITFFNGNPRYWTKNPHIRQKIAFFEVRCHFGPFSHKPKNQFFVEYSTGVEISTVKFSEKKLMMFVDIHNKYLELTLITYENIQKVNRIIFFSTSQ